MYLVDTNIFIEGLLAQEKAKDVQAFFQKVKINSGATGGDNNAISRHTRIKK